MDTPGNKKFIVIAEDNTLIAKVLSNKLTQAGYEVLVATNGQDALQAIAGRKPDLLLLDLIMPVKDGFTVLKEIRANPNLADLRVVVTSELHQQEDLQKVQQLGVSTILTKTNLHTIVEQLPKLL